MPLIDLKATSWQELISIAIQAIVAVATVGVAPWFGYKTFLEKNKIENAKERLLAQTAEIDKIRRISQAAKLEIRFYQKKNEELKESLLNIEIRAEAALEFTKVFYKANEKLNTNLIKQTPPEVINHLSVLRDQNSRQQRQLNYYHELFKEISILANTEKIDD